MKNGLIVDGCGTKFYYKDNMLHREDGPAVIHENGTLSYHINGKRHREDGPALIYWTGSVEYYIEDKLHREDGPAIIGLDGTLEYWIEGKLVDEYFKNFGCFKPKSREEALERLDSKERTFTRELYLADIDAKWPIEEK